MSMKNYMQTMIDNMIVTTSKAIDDHFFALVPRDAFSKVRLFVEQKPSGTLYTLYPKRGRNARKPIGKPFLVKSNFIYEDLPTN